MLKDLAENMSQEFSNQIWINKVQPNENIENKSRQPKHGESGNYSI